jgi:hypothetical protein
MNLMNKFSQRDLTSLLKLTAGRGTPVPCAFVHFLVLTEFSLEFGIWKIGNGYPKARKTSRLFMNLGRV